MLSRFHPDSDFPGAELCEKCINGRYWPARKTHLPIIELALIA
jgi:hypothetical protein